MRDLTANFAWLSLEEVRAQQYPEKPPVFLEFLI